MNYAERKKSRTVQYENKKSLNDPQRSTWIKYEEEEEYMTGYLNIIKSDIPSKTKEISFNILNRTCWTNQKRYKTLIANNMEEEGI